MSWKIYKKHNYWHKIRISSLVHAENIWKLCQEKLISIKKMIRESR